LLFRQQGITAEGRDAAADSACGIYNEYRSVLMIQIYTEDKIEDVLEFERNLRKEDFWGWEIDEDYIRSVRSSFEDPAFANSISLLACQENRVVGRIDCALIPSHFDGSVKAYLD
jgi:hypothetical protein